MLARLSWAFFVRTAALALVVAAACDAPATERPVEANQEPMAVLVLPEVVVAGVPVEISAEASVDLDGALVSAQLSFGDGSARVEVDLTAGGALRFTHAWQEPGLFDVELAVTDEEGLVGRARLRLPVEPPPDSAPPQLESLILRQGAETLADGARVAAGSLIEVEARASDGEGNLEAIDVEAGEAALSMLVEGFDAVGRGALVVEGEGIIPVRAVALDVWRNASPPRSQTLRVIAPGTDSDGDGLPDLEDPTPDHFNGLLAEVFALAGAIPTDLLGNQRAESVVGDIAGAVPAASFAVTSGYLAVDSTSAPLASLPSHAEAPPLREGFAVRYRGVLLAPAAATHVIVEVGADDVGVVFLDGAAVASADEEFATDFLRFRRAPVRSAPVALPAGGRLPLEIVVANDTGPWGWSVAFRFLEDGQSVMNPEAVGQRQFALP
jgi:hypothetical protein